MLERSIWVRYHGKLNIRTVLRNYYDDTQLESMEESETKLYAILKAKLTKKELRLLAMQSAAIPKEQILKELRCDEAKLEQIGAKLEAKMRGQKVVSALQKGSFQQKR